MFEGISGVLSRRMPINQVELIVRDILEDVVAVPNPDDLALEVAIKTGCSLSS
ncbi:MAG: hypothetical protein H0Z19_08875 [Archaeoglobus sp.]|uniref:hypothetical protein n=1 Tax=Archaeoglobus sp. TaxID=1872626 RepID=UPI001D9DE84A|nr:hypothetical protein [Archaeoglobus sp.]MBO8180569.1 hypothetical protein [Archaeoglobus sp.]